MALTDLAIDPTTGIMYGVCGNNPKFYTINTSTGQQFRLGKPGLVLQTEEASRRTGRERFLASVIFPSTASTRPRARRRKSVQERVFEIW